jgi:hypothetical protein
LQLAIDRFSKDDDRSKALVFISDWGDSGDNVSFNIDIPKNISYFVVWVWTEEWWKIIKWISPFWRPIYQKYRWNYVISKLNIDNLKNISSQLWANFMLLNDVWDLNKLDRYLEKLQKKAISLSWKWELNNLWRIFTFISLFFFLIFLLIYINPKILELWKKFES